MSLRHKAVCTISEAYSRGGGFSENGRVVKMSISLAEIYKEQQDEDLIIPQDGAGQDDENEYSYPNVIKKHPAPSDDKTQLEEEALISKCREGDAEACAMLVRKYASLIYSVPLHSFGMSQDDAEDVFQICYMKLFTRAKQFRGEARFSAWLRTVVRNICIDCIRSQKSALSLDMIADNCDSCPLSCFCRADSFLKKAEERSILKKAINKLPAHYRAPIELFFFEEKSYREISEILHRPVNTVGTHINRGLARLRKDLLVDPDSLEALVA